MSDNTTNNKNVRDDEINLLDLFRRMGRTITRWANALGTAFLISVVFIIRRWLPLLLSVLVGFGISYLMKKSSNSFYSSDIVFRNNLAQVDGKKHRDVSGTTFELISKINKLHSFCSETNKELFSKALSVKPEALKNISDISAFWIIDRNKDGIPDNVDYLGNHNIYDTINIRMPEIFDVK